MAMAASKKITAQVGVAELKAGLCRHLRRVREGGEVVVCDHGHPFARIVPYERPPVVREARGSIADWKPTHNIRVKTDVVALLLEDRESR